MMTRLLDLLGTHWFALVLLLLAAGLGGYAAVRRRAWPWYVGTSLAAFALGALFLHGWKYQLADDGPIRPLAPAVVYAGLALLAGAALVLVVFRGWSFWVGAAAAFVILAGLGGLGGRWLGSGIVEVAKSIAWVRFVSPWWLAFLLFVPAVYLISRKSLSGLGPVRRWVAIIARMLVVACLALALAEPRVRRPSENMTVLFVVDRSASVPAEYDDTVRTEFRVDLRWGRIRSLIENAVVSRYGVNRDDQFGVILFGKRPKLGYPPAPVVKVDVEERAAGALDPNYTDVAAALKLAMASFPEGTGKRIVLVSDGNENLGAAEEQAELARKNGIPIDTISLAPGFRNENEVLVTAVEAPPITAQGSRLPIRVLVRNAHPTRQVVGSLELVRVGGQGDDQPIDKRTLIDIEDGPGVEDTTRRPPKVRLLPGLNVFRFRDRDQARGESSYTYKASFAPDVRIEGDRVANNRADAAVVARGQRRVLFLDQAGGEDRSAHKHLLEQLRKARIQYIFLEVGRLPNDKTELGVYLSNFDCLVLANVPAEQLSTDQMEVIRTQVHDQGCGLVMVGGPDSFGPGGYQQTPVEAALPVDCEIKAKKATGKGGLILIMHASEMAEGNYWQKVIAKLAIQRLGPVDMVGVVDFGFLGGAVNWQIPFQEIGDGKEDMFAKVDRMNPGDMPDFDPFLQVAADTLSDPKHNLSVKHVILISDGDPNFGNVAAVKKMADNGITCTTIGVATHGVNEDAKMKRIAESTKDANGKPGNFYKVTDPTKLPAIYIKESRKISQSFIYDKPFDPALQVVGGPTEGLQRPLPKLYGFVRTTNKQSPTHQMHVEGPPDEQAKQQFPVVSSWRYGLGKSVAYTADARNDSKAWGRDWAASAMYQKFWENTINWAMREAERGKLTMVTEYRDGKVRVVLDARDEKDKAVIGLALKGRVTAPNKPQPGDKVPAVEFKPTGAGQYVAEFDAQEAGAYFVNVQAETEELGPDGKPVIDPNTKLPKMTAFDAARAGVTVPYSPEYADLESNTPLLRRIAERTGGNYFEEPTDPPALARMAEFFRKGPETVRSVLPFWFWLVFAAGLLLLFDVAVRRISVEPKEVRALSGRVWARIRRRPVAEEEDDGGMLGALGKRKRETADVLAKKRAARKFEAGDDAPGLAPAGADEYAAATDRPGALPPPPPTREAKPTEDEDDFMTRMRKAKERGKKKQDGE
jgi:secreted protein with Ig-like and vWFA domain/uncharacterized membrane protein